MARSDELDLLSSDTQSLLADARITVSQGRPTGIIDPDTRVRAVDAGATNPVVDAVESELYTVNTGARTILRRDWIVAAADVGFRPSREGTVTDEAEREWSIAEVNDMSNGREYRIVGEVAG